MAKRHKYLLCYDIADPKRLGRVHRRVAAFGERIQLSVYYLEVSAGELNALQKELEDVIDQCEDDIRIYRLPGNPRVESVGKRLHADGVSLSGAGFLD